MNVGDPRFPEHCEALKASNPTPAVCPGFPCEGQLWTSRTSARRGRVQWVSQGRVRLMFDDGTASIEHSTLDFLRLYREAR